MTEYIDREAFITEKRKQYCRECDRRKGMKNGKLKFCYEIGEAPCRSCGVDDALSDIEDYPAADVVEVVRCKDCRLWSSSLTKEEKQVLIDTNTDGVCEVWMSDGLMPNDFCSYGRRREDEG